MIKQFLLIFPSMQGLLLEAITINWLIIILIMNYANFMDHTRWEKQHTADSRCIEHRLFHVIRLTHPILEFVEFRCWIVERMMVERNAYFTEKVVPSKPVTIPHHDTQCPGLELALCHVVLTTHNTTY